MKLADFGIARSALREQHTQDGVIKGKLLYMAPEQATGDGAVDGRADLFALEVDLHEMLFGRRPLPAVDQSPAASISVPAPAPRRVTVESRASSRRRRFVVLLQLLESCGGIVAEAARRAGIDRVHLFRLIKKHGLQR